MLKWMLGLLLLSGVAGAQEADTTAEEGQDFQVIAFWGPEDRYLYKVEKIKLAYQNGLLVKNDTVRYEALFEVLDSTETSYELAWTVQEGVLPQLSLPDSIQRKLRDMSAEPISYVYRTDELGAFESLLNQSEVRMELLKQFAVLEDVFSEQEQRNQFSALLAPFKNIILSDAGIEQLVAKELNFFHLLYGMGMDSGEHFYYDEQYPNLVGGDPILGKGHLYQTLVDTVEGRFTVVNEVVTDPKSTKAYMKQAVPILVPNLKDSKDFKKAFKNSRMQITDRQVYDFYYGFYLPHLITTERRTEVVLPNEKRVQVDQLNLYLVYD